MKRSICIFLALLAAFLLLPVPSAFAGAALYEGIDLSVWQGTVDFNQVKADGKEIVYIRAGEGTQEDTRFAENADGAKGAGLKFGFYFYVTAQNTDQARQQAEYFASLIEPYGYDCRPAVDF